ncbi:hypothetical protein BDZ90DRAFT_260963 [Jaminaea rosea]|uniref:Uncharacterized protein n=1 Tax=Jaminaea rosea TaxID=1569628 RepID=A0A316UN66_9BASI|nr:hypothetical protein BDZ90DRAFT_260963 [Jaminaea rosea]PWN26700.1 hypothetical protein BDZ90DRAFT_260963 [Jaminaea rosea]
MDALLDDEAAGSAYEQERLANMRANAELLSSMGLATPAKVPRRRIKRQSEEAGPSTPRRITRSARGGQTVPPSPAESIPSAQKAATRSPSPWFYCEAYPDEDYESIRQANIRANAELLLSLGLTGLDSGRKELLEERVAGRQEDADEVEQQQASDGSLPRVTPLARKMRETKARHQAERAELVPRRSARIAVVAVAAKSKAKDRQAKRRRVGATSSLAEEWVSQVETSISRSRMRHRAIYVDGLASMSPSTPHRKRRGSTAATTTSISSSATDCPSLSSSISLSSASPSSYPMTPSSSRGTPSRRGSATSSGHYSWTSPGSASSASAISSSPTRSSARQRRPPPYWPSYVVRVKKGAEAGTMRDSAVVIDDKDEDEDDEEVAALLSSCRLLQQLDELPPPSDSAADAAEMWVQMDLPEGTGDGSEWWREGRGEQSAWCGRRFLPRLAARA